MLLEVPVQTLRGDVVTVMAATFIASLGIAALALYALRRRAADLTALAFALFALMYAIRLATATGTIQTVLSDSSGPWGYLNAGLTLHHSPCRCLDGRNPAGRRLAWISQNRADDRPRRRSDRHSRDVRYRSA